MTLEPASRLEVAQRLVDDLRAHVGEAAKGEARVYVGEIKAKIPFFRAVVLLVRFRQLLETYPSTLNIKQGWNKVLTSRRRRSSNFQALHLAVLVIGQCQSPLPVEKHVSVIFLCR